MSFVTFFSRSMISFLLFFSILIFIAIYSVQNVVNIENINDLVREATSDAYINRVLEKSDETDSEEIYNEFMIECQTSNIVSLEEINATLDCDDIRKAGPEGTRELVLDKVKIAVEKSISEAINLSAFEGYLRIFKITLWISGILVLIFVFLLIVLSNPWYHFLFNLGLVSTLLGSLSGLLNKYRNLTSFTEYEFTDRIFSALFNELYKNLLFLLAMGIACFIILFLVFILKIIIKSQDKEETEEKQSSDNIEEMNLKPKKEKKRKSKSK